MSAPAAGPRTPPPAPSKRPARYPLYDERPTAPSAERLSETAIAPLGRPPVVAPSPEPERRLPLTDRIARTVAGGDPTWLMSFGVLVGVLVAVFVLGCLLLFL